MNTTPDLNALRESMQGVLRSVFMDDAIVITDSTKAGDIDGWDSLGHINLIIAVEKQFKVKIATAEISRLKSPDQNIGSFLRLLQDKIGAKR